MAVNNTIVYGDLSKSTSLKTSNADKVLQAINVQPSEEALYSNSWGDAFVSVFASTHTALRYALEVRDGLRLHDWRADGIARPPHFRIALDAGAVDWNNEDLQHRQVPEGKPFVQAARIEPVTGPGEVFTTETVRLLAEGPYFYFEPLGLRSLPKGYGEVELFRAHWAAEASAVLERCAGPLLDDQFYFREEALRRFSLLWLILDQLPVGSWGRSVPSWMREVWRGIPTLSPNQIMEEEGGFETTIFNLELLASINALDGSMQDTVTRGIEYITGRHVHRGFGTLSLSRHGFGVEPHPRHTALAGWLIGSVLKSETLHDPNYRELFHVAVHALFDGDQAAIARDYLADRNPLLLYLAAWHVASQLGSPEWSQFFEREDVERMLNCWAATAPELEKRALRDRYEHPQPKHLCDKQSIRPLIIPYGEFIRMESYSLLSAAALIHEGMPDDIKDRIRRGVEFVVKRYLSQYGEPTARYTRDPLRSKHRGPMAYSAVDPQKHPDLGTAAMLVRTLRAPISRTLWPDGLSPELRKARYLLIEDLIELFDRYLLEPRFYSLTHAGMLACILVGDHPSLRSVTLDQCRLIAEHLPPVEMKDDRLAEVVSEQRLEQLVEEVIAHDASAGPIQIATHSLTRLLLDRLRPGRYVKESISDEGVKEISRRTLDVYRRPSFAEKYDRSWGESPDRVISAPFIELIGIKAKVLDVGCGPGQYAVEFARAGHTVTLLDASRPFLQIASSRVERETGKQPRTILCDILDHPSRGSLRSRPQYDAIWCSGVFVHIPAIAQPEVVKWFHRLLRPGGHLFINVMIDNPRVFARDGRYFTYIGDANQFQTTLSECGFETEYVLLKSIKRNTYGEPFFETQWGNYYLRKSDVSEAIDIGAVAAALTSPAYQRSVKAFMSVHREERVSKRNEFIQSQLDQLELHAGRDDLRILDAGCGFGDFVIAMAKRGWQGVGIDISEQMIQSARDNCPLELRNLATFELADMRSLPSDWTDHFDGITCITALQHIPEEGGHLLRTLREFARVLRPNGILRIDMRQGGNSGFEQDLRYIQAFPNEKAMLDFVSHAGFKVLDHKLNEIAAGQNTFRRQIAMHYVVMWLTKRA